MAGVGLGRSPTVTASVRSFHESLSATAEAALFLILGLRVFPSRLVDDLGTATVIAVALIVLARPLAVLACLVWFRWSRAELLLVSWAGLRGAVPIVLGTIALSEGHPAGALVFEVVFVVVLVSVALQSTTVVPLARRLGLADHRAPPSPDPEPMSQEA